MSDLMTREEAIQELKEINTALESWSGFTKYPHALYIAIDMAIEALRQPPNEDWERYSDHLWKEAYERGKQEALKDRPHGEWIEAEGMMPPEFHFRHCCSECGNFANMEPPFGNREDLSKFCPNCGADMRGSKE